MTVKCSTQIRNSVLTDYSRIIFGKKVNDWRAEKKNHFLTSISMKKRGPFVILS